MWDQYNELGIPCIHRESPHALPQPDDSWRLIDLHYLHIFLALVTMNSLVEILVNRTVVESKHLKIQVYKKRWFLS
jgi:hypothetical protein